MTVEEQPGEKVRWMTVEEGHAGQRIDNFLLRELRGVPKSRIYRLLRKGEVRVNKARIKPDFKLSSGDQVRIPPVRQSAPAVVGPVSGGLAGRLHEAVLYEDEDLLIVDKPAGLAVHGGSGINLGLIEAMRQLRPELRSLELVHRLDRETSGCILLSKKRAALRELHAMLRDAAVDKRYWALVAGRWPKRREQVKSGLTKNTLQSGERMVRVDPDGKLSLTEFRVLTVYAGASLVEARPVTGRTHQIRVHCRAAGHPILGDEKYGDSEANQRFRELGLRRLFLHARELRFVYRGQQIHVQAPLEPSLENLLGKLDKL